VSKEKKKLQNPYSNQTADEHYAMSSCDVGVPSLGMQQM